MRSTLLLTCILVASLTVNAQNTLIPDANFEQALINLGHDTILDGQVLTSNINALTDLDVSFEGISDLTGIQDFTALETLNCSVNSISNLDLSNNSALTQLSSYGNLLTSLDVTNNPALFELSLSGNQITTIDVSNNLLLGNLYMVSNQLTSIDLSNNVNLTRLSLGGNQLSSIDVSSNLSLTNLDVDSNDLTSIDVSNNVALIDFSIRSNDLTSLDVSANTLLEILDYYANDISTIDLSNNAALIQLTVGQNPMTLLNLINQTSLITLSVSGTDLTALDLSNNVQLGLLLFSFTDLTEIDLSANVNLFSIIGRNTQLETIDLVNNSLLERVQLENNSLLRNINIKNGNNVLIDQFDAANSPNLSCIQVDNEVDANNGSGGYGVWLKDDTAEYSEHCLDTYVPDDNFEQALIDLGHDSGSLDDYVPTSNIDTIINLNVDDEDISDMTGIEDFEALEELRCRNNFFTSLDLSNNTNMTFLRCENNVLQSLNLKNDNNAVFTTMRAENNNFLCVEVDDEVNANAGTGSYSSWQVDAGVSYSENCDGCPEMNIQGNALSISSGDTTPRINDHTDFGVVSFGTFEERTFTIENLQNVDLNLTGTPLIVITNSVDFTITSLPSATITANGGTTSFVVRYTPSMAGTINTATLSIANDDCDENPYTFDVIGESDNTLGLNQSDAFNDQIKILPNPNNGSFALIYRGNENLRKLNVYDINGKLMLSNDLSNFQSESRIDLNLPKGMYFLNIVGAMSNATQKLIIN